MEIYLTHEDFKTAEANGIPYATAYARFYNYGWNVEDTITIPVKKRSEGLWPKYKELCEKNGISQHTFYDRIRDRGWTPEEAATKKLLPSFRRPNAKVTKEAIEQAEKNGISERTLKHRVYHYKWDVERAMTQPLYAHRRKQHPLRMVKK